MPEFNDVVRQCGTSEVCLARPFKQIHWKQTTAGILKLVLGEK